MVCYSSGVINTLVEKLSTLRDGKHPIPDELLVQLQDLKSLREYLQNKFAGGWATDEQVKAWMKQVRELAYDIEDWIDPFLHERRDAQIDPKQGTDMGDSETARKFMDRIHEALDRCTRYGLVDKAPVSDPVVYSRSEAAAASASGISAATVDSPLLCGMRDVLVGVDGPKKEVEDYLKDTQKKLKVVSILGEGGLGKTTLAKEIYGDLKGQFDCHAFVSIGSNTLTATTLNDIFHGVTFSMDKHMASEQKVIAQLREFLLNKRYLIVVDDIRNTRAWKVINCALPDNNLESRVLTTTRIKDVAMFCSRRRNDIVYIMKPLGEEDSRRLLAIKISVPKEEWRDDLEEVSNSMLSICGGIPLAIIVSAGLLGRRLWVSLKILKQPLLTLLMKHSTFEGMKKILDVSFSDLPMPAKSCLLYFSAFPEKYAINKDCLIRKWIAEGFIPQRDEEILWATGEKYFNDLIRRRLIQPIFSYDDDDDFSERWCVHGVVHEFIKFLSRKENFLSAGEELKFGSFPCDVIRRFMVDCNDEDEPSTLVSNTMWLSRVRSLTVFGGVKAMPDLLAFKCLRVLDLEDTKGLERKQLRNIGCLFLLRYLALRGSDATEICEEIGQLEHLLTLDLRRTRVRHLPSFTSAKLVSLLVDDVELPTGTSEMHKLEEVSTINIGKINSVDDVAKVVNKSTPLRMLGIKIDLKSHTRTYSYRQGLKGLLDEVGKSSLESLCLDCFPSHLLDLLLECWAQTRPCHLQRFELRFSMYDRLSEVPWQMGSLIDITHLHIEVIKALEAKHLRILGDLPNLVYLKLISKGAPDRCIISKDNFRCLKVFWSIFSNGAMWLQFEEGSMSQLQRLQLRFNARSTKDIYQDFDFRIHHLCSLLIVHVTLSGVLAAKSDVDAAEAAIKDQVSKVPSNPKLQISRVGEGDVMANANSILQLSSEGGKGSFNYY